MTPKDADAIAAVLIDAMRTLLVPLAERIARVEHAIAAGAAGENAGHVLALEQEIATLREKLAVASAPWGAPVAAPSESGPGPT